MELYVVKTMSISIIPVVRVNLVFERWEEVDADWPGLLARLGPVHVRQLTNTEAVSARRVSVAVGGDRLTRRRHLEDLSHLLVQLEVGHGAPELRSCNRRSFSVNMRDVKVKFEYNI